MTTIVHYNNGLLCFSHNSVSWDIGYCLVCAVSLSSQPITGEHCVYAEEIEEHFHVYTFPSALQKTGKSFA